MSTDTQKKVVRAARVFVLEDQNSVDISKARIFGEEVYLFSKNEEDRPNVWTERFCDECVERLEQQNYNPEIDYLLIVGHMPPIIILVATIIRNWGECESVKALFWTKQAQNYLLMEL